MVKYFLMSIGMVAYCSIACAQVKVMTNTELDEVVLATRQPQLQPVLPEYDSNGQIGGLTRALSSSSQPVVVGLSTPAVTPTASTGLNNGGIALQLPVSPLTDLILNLPSRNINIPQNVVR